MTKKWKIIFGLASIALLMGLLVMVSGMNKKYFKVILRGENYLIDVEGSPRKLGFYATRFVSATDESAAEMEGVKLIKSDSTLTKSVLNPKTDSPMIYLDEIEQVAEIEGPGAGYTFFPMEKGSEQ